MTKTNAVSRKRLAPTHASSQANSPKKVRKQKPASSISSVELIPSHQLKRFRRRERAHLRRQDAVDLEEGDDRSVGQLAQVQDVGEAAEQEAPEEEVEEVEQHAPQQIDQTHDDSEYFHTSFGGRNSQERNQRIERWMNTVSGAPSDNEEEHAERVGSIHRNTSLHAEALASDNLNDADPNTFPDAFMDPLTADLMRDPVFLPTSRVTVDRSTIAMYLRSMPSRDPFSGLPLRIEDVIPNAVLKSAIDDFLATKKAKVKAPEAPPSRRHLFVGDEDVADGTGSARRRLFEEVEPDGTPCPQKTKHYAGSDENPAQVDQTSADRTYHNREDFPEENYNLAHDGLHSKATTCNDPACSCRRFRPIAVPEIQSDELSHASYDSSASYHSYHDFSEQSHCSLCENLAADAERVRCLQPACPCHETHDSEDSDANNNSESRSNPALATKHAETSTSRSASPLPQLQRRRTGLALAPRGGRPDIPFSGRQTRQTAAATRMRNAPLEPGQGYVSISIAEQQQAQMLVGLYGGRDDGDE